MILSIRDIGKIHIRKYEISNADIVIMCVCDFMPWNVYYADTSSLTTIIKNKIDKIY